jgi:hypothetical protein
MSNFKVIHDTYKRVDPGRKERKGATTYVGGILWISSSTVLSFF